MTRTTWLAAALAFAAAPAHAAAATDSLRVYVAGLAAFGFDGQIVVAAGDSILIDHASGTADRAGAPIGKRTCFAAGSIAKSLTGALVVRLAARGTLGLDDSLGARLPQAPEDKRGITLRQLLTHTSGLPQDAAEVAEGDPRDTVVRKILAERLRQPPGERFGYSNAGYQLLAAVIEHATGRPFAELLAEELLAPAGMTTSGTGAAAAARCEAAAAGRNEWRFLGSLSDWRQRWAGTGAGDLVTTARDLWRWGRALQGQGPLGAAELDTMLAPRVAMRRGLEYGFGVYRVPVADGPALLSIGGDVPGYHAAAWIERQAPWRIAVVVMSGERHGRSLVVSTVQRALWRILNREPVSMPPATIPWPASVPTSLAGDYTLPEDAALDLTPDGGGLRLGLAGPRAMDLVYGPDSSRAWLDARAAQVFRAAANPRDSALAKALHPVENDLWGRTLLSRMSEHATRLGALRDVILRGTVPLPWLEQGHRTYVTLRCARGVTDASLAWLDGGLLDVAFGEGRPHPVILPVAPLAEGGLAAWDVLDGRVLRLEPVREGRRQAILVAGPRERLIARRRR
jgi:CubicO group peptidase (beta-lactamase class C family)